MKKSGTVRHRRRAVGVALAALLVVAGCGGDDDDGGDSAESTAAPETTAAATPDTTAAPTPETTAAATPETTAAMTPETTEAAPETTTVDPTAEIDALYTAAQEEGALMIYTTSPEIQTEPHIEAFKAAYPGIEVEFLRLSTNELLQRFASEADAGVNAADLLLTPDSTFIHNAIADGTIVSLDEALPGGFPESVPGFPEEFVFYDGETGGYGVSPIGITYNTDRVPAEEAPTSFEELLDSRWTGAVASSNPAEAGVAFFDFWHFAQLTYGDEFLQAFAQQDVDWSQLPVPQAQALAAGEYDLVTPGFGVLTLSLAEGGAPVAINIPEVTTGSVAVLGVASEAPNPNAARLFAHWTMTAEGTKAYNAPVPLNGDPWGGDQPPPPGFVFPDSAVANTEERRAELLALLGL